jgi:hypothetical protein
VIQPTNHLEVLEASQVLIHGGVLPREADLLAHLGGVANDIETCDARRALIRE